MTYIIHVLITIGLCKRPAARILETFIDVPRSLARGPVEGPLPVVVLAALERQPPPTVVLVVLPLPLVNCLVVRVGERALTVEVVVVEVTYVLISIIIVEDSFALGLMVPPLSLMP